MTDPYVDLESLYEPIIEAYKQELADLEIFDKISEGEDLYEQGKIEAWIIPGRDRVESAGMHMLRHYLEMNIIIFSSAENATQAELRKFGHQVYNKLMEDITHGETCMWALPILFHPGYMNLGDIMTVGVLIQHICHFTQFYPLPS